MTGKNRTWSAESKPEMTVNVLHGWTRRWSNHDGLKMVVEVERSWASDFQKLASWNARSDFMSNSGEVRITPPTPGKVERTSLHLTSWKGCVLHYTLALSLIFMLVCLWCTCHCAFGMWCPFEFCRWLWFHFDVESLQSTQFIWLWLQFHLISVDHRTFVHIWALSSFHCDLSCLLDELRLL